MIAMSEFRRRDIGRIVDENLARKALVRLLDFMVHTTLYADDALVACTLNTIEVLQSYIGFPMPAAQAVLLYRGLIDAGWQPNPAEWPDQAE